MSSGELSMLGEDEEEDYYGLFNIPRTATEEEITRAYRKLSMMYHPDRHQEPELKEQAEAHFRKLNNAYEVLKDPQKRRIYDTVGVKGLAIQGWELVERNGSIEDIRAEYERLLRLKEERLLQEEVNPNGGVEIVVNAVDVFQGDSYLEGFQDDPDAPSFSLMDKLELQSVSMEQSVEASATAEDRLIFSGGLSTKNGVGGANMILGWRRLWGSHTWGIAQLGFGDNFFVTYKLVRTISKHMVGTLQVTAFDKLGWKPGISGSIETQLDLRTAGTIRLTGGLQNAFIVKLVRKDVRRVWQFSGSLVISRGGSHLAFEALRQFKEQDDGGHFKASLKGGTFGAILGASYIRKVSQHNKIGWAVSVHVPHGTVTFSFKVQRASQQYTAKFIICDDPEYVVSTLGYGVLVPLAVTQLAWVMLRPRLSRYFNPSNSKEEMEALQMREQKRHEASVEIQLMKETCQRSREQEERKKGLVIVQGWYGQLIATTDSELQGSSADRVWDVSVPLQVLVKDSKLILYEDNRKSQLPGFFDPCPGVQKKLRVSYKFKDQDHAVTIRDDEGLFIPKKSHIVNFNGHT